MMCSESDKKLHNSFFSVIFAKKLQKQKCYAVKNRIGKFFFHKR